MFRTSDMVLIAVMVSAAAFTYQTKHEAESWLSEVRRLEREIRFEEDTIDLLKADWSLLTQPSRLQRLTEIYHDQLGLDPVGAQQIVELDDVPERSLTIEDLSSGKLGAMAEGAKDNTVTGGVVR